LGDNFFRNFFFISFLIGLLFLSCQGDSEYAAVHADDKDSKVIVKIGDEKIPLSSFHKYIKLHFSDEALTLDDEVLSIFLDDFIEEQLLLREARKNMVIVSNTELNEITRQSMTAEAPFSNDASVNRERRESLRKSLILQKFISQYIVKDLSISFKEIENYYKDHKEDFMVPEEVRVSQILVRSQEEAEEILSQLRRKGADFHQLARQFSISPEASNGGDMGYFSEGQLPPEFEKVIFSLNEGRYSSIIPSSYGYHIFLLEERRPSGQLSLTEVMDSIRIKLLQETSETRLKEYVKKLKEEVPIKIYRKNLDFRYKNNY
jgi:parvulin-like peptidyl-prolyl isomerase